MHHHYGKTPLSICSLLHTLTTLSFFMELHRCSAYVGIERYTCIYECMLHVILVELEIWGGIDVTQCV